MVVYIIPILLCLLTAVTRELSDNRRWTIFMVTLLCLIYCFGYMTGSDWRSYEYWYKYLDFNRFYYGYINEPGYYLYMMLFNKCGIPFWPFFVMTKIVVFLIMIKSFFLICKDSVWISLSYFLPLTGMYLFIDNPMRNAIAAGIFMLSLNCIIDKKFWRYFLTCLLAASFHATALLMIPFYWLLNKRVKTITYVILFLVINILFINRQLLIDIIVYVFGFIPFFNDKVVSYFLMDSVFIEGKVFSFGLIWHTALFILLLIYRDPVINRIGERYGTLAYNSAMIYLLLFRLALSIPLAMRFQLYFSVCFCICVGLLVLCFEWRSRLMYVCVLGMVSLYICIDSVTSTARYIPYSNILEYALKGDNPSFSTRFFYNIKHSPYTKEIDVPK